MAEMSDLYSTETTTILAACLIAVCGLFLLFRRSARRLPPGPIGLPIVGYLPFLTRKPHLKLIELRKKYGPVFSVKLGSHNVVVLCDFKSIRDAFVQDAFMGRPPITPFKLHKETIEKEVLSGIKWKEQKRFCLQLLRNLGFAKSDMEDHIKEEIRCVLDIIEEQEGQPMFMRPILAPSMSNNMASLAFGKRMKYSDPKRIMLDNLLKDVGRNAGQVALSVFFPWLKPIMIRLRLGNVRKLDEAIDKVKDFFSEEIKNHEKTLDKENIRDFIDGYLVQIEKKKDNPDTTFLKPVLQDMVQAFFGAGSDTVRITVEWLLMVSAAFRDVQKRVQREIDEVIGAERFPSYSDHSKMPYAEAVIMEVLRWRNIIPVNFLRCTLEDTEINSFFIAKGTYIMGNQWAVQHDPALWGHPETFRPERFLTEDGKGIERPEYHIPFSIGKRSCPGETYAMIEVFLYFTAILQKFSVSVPDGAALDMEGQLGLSLQPKPQQIILKVRH